MERIGIIDLGVGNFANVRKALDGEMIASPERLDDFNKIVLPGVGSFDGVAQKLERYRDAIQRFVASGRYFLGICLGMQLLFECSEEGSSPGLGILPGGIVRFQGVQTPHMGWNSVRFPSDELTADIPRESYFYFVHSYYLPSRNRAFEYGFTSHGEAGNVIRFVSAVRRENIIGVQFHPEKSSFAGKSFLGGFKRL